jgi:hypothetical protein
MFQDNLLSNYELRKNKLLKSIDEFDINSKSNEKINLLITDLNEFYQLISAAKFSLEFTQIAKETISNHPIFDQIIKSDISVNILNQDTGSVSTEEIKTEESLNIDSVQIPTQISELESLEEIKLINLDKNDKNQSSIDVNIENKILDETLSSSDSNEIINEIKISSKTETTNKINETDVPQNIVSSSDSKRNIKKIEFSINDKFRIINELFGQSQIEFNTAIEQLNSCISLEESENYLHNLKIIYNWKINSPLVKVLFAINHKRF